MQPPPCFSGDTTIHRLDPRGRVVVAFVLSVLLAVSSRMCVGAAGLAIAFALACLARLPLEAMLWRMLMLNGFMAILAVVMPFSVPGRILADVGPLSFSRDGLLLAIGIALKSNEIVLILAALVATIEPESLGHALNHLGVPHKLTHLFLFTVRYIGVLTREYARLAAAMRVRCFRARANAHTYRSLGYLVGMLLVKSFDRSERILAAMKCRGFRGRYYLLDHFVFGRRDVVFGVVSMLLMAALACAEWT